MGSGYCSPTPDLRLLYSVPYPLPLDLFRL